MRMMSTEAFLCRSLPYPTKTRSRCSSRASRYPLTLSRGRYILSCRNANGGAMKLPLLMYRGTYLEAPTWSAWHRQSGQRWVSSSPAEGNEVH